MSFELSITQLAQAAKAIEVIGNSNSPITKLVMDSRKIISPSHAAFIAIKGEHHDGHHYIEDAYKAGIHVFLIEEKSIRPTLENVCWIIVKNSVEALQNIAANHRHQFSIPVIGITGSNGKTIVKEWLNQLLADDYNIVRSPKSYNSQIGVPLSVLTIESSHTLGIFEAGISLPSEMERLQKIIDPNIGIITNIGEAHLENFIDQNSLIQEKIELFKSSKIIIANGNIPALNEALYRNKRDARILTWGSNNQCDLVIEHVSVHAQSARLDLEFLDQKFSVNIPFSDKASVENACTCVLALLHLGLDITTISERIGRLSPVSMRLQLIEGTHNSLLINDAYSSDLQSLEIALDFMKRHSGSKPTCVILSDILQSATPEHELHHRICKLLMSKNIEQFVGVGPSMIKNKNVYSQIPHSLFFETTAGLIESLKPNDYSGRIILIKGARDFKFERIVSSLQERTHETVLEIDLNAMRGNLLYFKEKLKQEVKLMVMVKAAGYGAGAKEVAELLEFNKVDYLAVAYTDEGVALRQAGISLPIMVMNAELTGHEALIKHRLEPVIFSIRSLEQFLAALSEMAVSEAFPVHLKLDTGMHRLGFSEEELPQLLEKLASIQQIRIASIFTHLVASDSPAHDDFTRKQLYSFEKMCAEIDTALTYRPMRHACNTGAIQRFPEAQYNMVRLGIGLYGISAYGPEQDSLETVSTLKTSISQIKKIKIGESVGYNRSFIAKKDSTIATIPLGYADGLRRSLSNGNGSVWIDEKNCPIVGNVCMDMTMVDISETNAKEGDEVIVFGRQISLSEFAQKCETIPYEILTSISQRVKRIYLEE